MKKITLLHIPILAMVAVFTCMPQAFGQISPAPSNDVDSPLIVDIEKVTLSVTRGAEGRSKLANQVEIIDGKTGVLNNQPTTAELLMNTGKVFIQKSQLGGGSPVLRGFEANRVLLVVDGIRMNNAIYRAGHLQDVITMDQMVLQRTEIVFGPSSVMYGSDAFGGVMAFFTKDPSIYFDKQWKVNPEALVRLGSAANEQTFNFGLNVSKNRVGFRFNLTHSDFGDLRSGSRRNFDDPQFGLRNVYVARINHRDSVVKNPDPLIQKGSAYKQTDFFAKLAWLPNNQTRHTLNFQWSNSGDVPRYDRLSEIRNGQPRFAYWSYVPQSRNLLAYHFHSVKSRIWTEEIKITASRQQIFQGRASRTLNSANELKQTENVEVYALNADFKRSFVRHEFRYGAEWVRNQVNSSAVTKNVNTGAETASSSTRYPDAGSNTQSIAAYLSHIYKFKNPKWVLNQGLRLTQQTLNARFSQQSLIGEFDVKQSYLAPAYQVGMVFTPTERSTFRGMGNTGFRAPNVDDLGKVFDSRPGALIIPNANAKAEYSYNTEVSYNYNHFGNINIELGAYHTWLSNILVVQNAQLNGMDSVVFQGLNSRVQSMQNADRGRVMGAWAAVKVWFSLRWTAEATATYTYGRYNPTNGVEVPLDHIPPVFGKVGIKYYDYDKLEFELFARFNRAKALKDYSPSGEDNLQYTLAGGSPSWTTFNLRGAYHFVDHITISASIENLADLHYRYFASGISAPGRNIVVTAMIRI